MTEYADDCAKLSSMELRKKYPAEHNSHRAMLARRADGAMVSADLVNFKDFLLHLGPCPEPGYTIDRLNNDDPEYAPGKIRWRSKKDQTRNRSNTIHLTDLDGTRRSLAEWAELRGVSRHTMHARRRRGYSDPEVIHGPHDAHGGRGDNTVSGAWPWPPKSAATWERGFRRNAWTVPRRETRTEFMARIASRNYHAVLDEIERTVSPYCEAGPEHDELFRNWEGWAKVLRRARLLLAEQR